MAVQIDGSQGSVIATSGDYSGGVSFGGTLTYEDVTNIPWIEIDHSRDLEKANSKVVPSINNYLIGV